MSPGGPLEAGHDGAVEDRERLLPLVGAYNFRDLGGYPTVDGRTTRWNVLFRSDTLHELTTDDLEALRRLGLAGVIDLRTATEVERSGRGRLAGEPIRYLHASVIGSEGGETVAAPSPEEDGSHARYLWYLSTGRRALLAALEMMADPSSYPLVFHCAAGKDRAGVLAALVLDLLGVEPEVIVEDYVLTESRMDLIRARLRRDPIYRDRIDQIPASRLAVEATTMERFLEELHRRHGGARAWAVGAGLAPGRADQLVDLLLEPA
jgi:protein tyrosine/serine phosphatase